jgi:DNA invertase Pin-like site-specific DNA recombinase
MESQMSEATTTGTGQRIGYIRVSSEGQNNERQLDGVALDMTFSEKVSGKDTDRPQLKAMLAHARKGDVIFVHSMDRLSRSLRDLEAIVTGLTKRGVTVSFKHPAMTFTGEDSPMSMLMLQMLGAVGQFERALIRERQMEGIAIAKTKSVYKGRKPALDDAGVAKLKKMAAEGSAKVEIAKRFGISRASVYAYLNA